MAVVEAGQEGPYAVRLAGSMTGRDEPSEDIVEYLRDLSRQLEVAPSAEVAKRASTTIAKLTPEQQATLAQLIADLLRRLEEIAEHHRPPENHV